MTGHTNLDQCYIHQGILPTGIFSFQNIRIWPQHLYGSLWVVLKREIFVSPVFVNLTLFPRWSQHSTSLHLPMMAITSTLSLLLVAIVKMAQTQSQCKTSEICELENTGALSTTSSLILKNSVYLESCSVMCSMHVKCMATSYDPATGNCELHEAYADGAPCIVLSAEIGSTFSMLKLPGTSCPQVRHWK